MTHHRLSRRRLLQTAGLGAGCLFLPESRSVRSSPANDTLNIALVGVGRRGRGFVHSIHAAGQRMEKIAGRPLDWKQGWTPQSGTLLVGSKGVVHTNAHNSLCSLLPEKDFPQARGRPRSLPSVASHQIEWLNACKGGPAPLSSFDHSGPVMEVLLAGNIATLVDKPPEFDPVAGTIPNHETANTALRRHYAKGWFL